MTSEDPKGGVDRLLRELAQAPEASNRPALLPFGGTSRYQLLRRLGSGGFGVVYLVRDLTAGADVALKTLPIARPELVYRLKHEFRSLADIRHQNLVAFYEMSAEENQCFFTMEYVPGPDFIGWVRPHGVLDERRLRSALAQLAAGLSFLHRAGKLHRDVKPSNVLLSGERVVLLDFGLATELGESGVGRSVELAGTPEYMSPEQMRGEPTSPASDWYGVGVLLYQALTGEMPFRGTWAELLAARERAEPPSPSVRQQGVPRDLCELCQAILAQEPAKRPGADAFAALLGRDRFGERERVRDSSEDATFVGRESELAVLGEAVNRVRDGRGVTVRVEGASGAGKTALVEHFISLILREGAAVLRGRCYVRERVPYQGIDSLVDELCRFLRGLGTEAAESLLPMHLGALVQLFPVMERIPKANETSRRRGGIAQEQQELRRQAFVALREMLGRIAEKHLLVVHIDDLQWSDLDTAALLREVLRPPDAPGMLLILTSRAEDRDRSPGLRALAEGALGDVMSIQLGPLSAEASLALARRLLGNHSGEDAARMAMESRGSPFFLRELARYASDQGLARSAPLDLRSALQARIRSLPCEAAGLMEIVAVAGHPIPEEVARRAAGTATPPWEAWAPLDGGRLIRFSGPRDQRLVEPFHDQVREALLADLPPDRKVECHRSLAAALEEAARGDPVVLARHHEAAGNGRRARELALDAAVQASKVLAFDRAARLFRWALDLDPGDAADRVSLLTSLAGALANAGRGVEAAKTYLSAAERAPPAVRADLRRRAAEQFLFSGRIDEGRELVSDDLRAAGFPIPATPARALASLVVNRALLRLRGLGFRQRTEQEVPRYRLDTLEHLWAIIRGLSLLDVVRASELATRMLLLALRSGVPRHVAQALVMCAGHAAAESAHSSRTEALTRRMDELSARVEDGSVNGYGDWVRAIRAVLGGSWRDGLALTDEVERYFRDDRVGMTWEVWTMRMFSNWALFYLGRLGDLSSRFERHLAEARDRGNAYGLAVTLVPYGAVTWLVRGDLDAARRAVQEARTGWSLSGFQLQHLWFLFAESLLDLYQRNGNEAWARVRSQWPRLTTSLALRVPLLRMQMLHVRGSCALAAAVETRRNGRAIEPLLRDVERTARRLARVHMPPARPLALLLQSGAAMQRGREDEAAHRLNAAARGLEQCETAVYAGAARHHLARLKGGTQAVPMLSAELVAHDESFADMLAPGFLP